MEFRDLDLFRLAGENLSFTRAAELAHLTPTTFGHRIRQLETELGVVLFERSSHGIRLTAAGERLLTPVGDVLAARTAMLDAAHAVTNGDRGRVRIGWPGFGIGPLGPVLFDGIRAARPGVDVVVDHRASVEGLPALLDGEVDLLASYHRSDDSRLGWSHPCVAQPRLLVVAADDDLARLGEIGAGDLGGRSYVPNRFVEAGFDAWGRLPDVVTTSLDVPARSLTELCARVTRGGVVSLVPQPLAEYYAMPGVVCRPFLDAEMAKVQFGWRLADSDPVVAHVRDDLVAACADHPALGGLRRPSAASAAGSALPVAAAPHP